MMDKSELLQSLKDVQEKFFSYDYYFSLDYWEAVQELIKRAEEIE